MRFLASSIIITISFITASCASKKLSSNYETYNEALERNSQGTSSSKLVTNFDDLPKFNNLRGKMAPGHEFYLYHPSDEKLKGKFRADFNGNLRLPYNVVINVTGLTYSELRAQVLEKYSKFFQRGVENVSFKLLRMDYLVEVRGLVKKSGKYYVSRNEGLDKLIDKAGGLRGDLQNRFYKASIKQEKDFYSISLNQYYQNSKYNNAFVWTGGDRIFVTELDESEMTSSLPIITILGGVNNPGKVLYKEKANIFYYIGKSGGAIDSLDYDESYIVRTTKDGMYKIQFDLTNMDRIPALAPNDVILLQAEKESFADRMWNRLVQFATIITSVAVLMAL